MSENKEQIAVYQTSQGEVSLSANVIAKYLVRGYKENITKEEVMNFLFLCKYNKLNPFINEAYLVKFGEVAQMVIGKDVYIKRANRNKDYNGHKAGIIVVRNEKIEEVEGTFYLDTDVLVGGWAEVHFKGKIPLKTTVKLSEYNTNKSIWKGKPATMIRKVALSHALREAFPEEVTGMYGEEEVGVDTSKFGRVTPPIEVVQEEKPKAIDPFADAVDTEVISEPKKEEKPEPKIKENKKSGQMTIEISEEEEEAAPFLQQDFNSDEECDF